MANAGDEQQRERQRQQRELAETRRNFAETGARTGSLFEPTRNSSVSATAHHHQRARARMPRGDEAATGGAGGSRGRGDRSGSSGSVGSNREPVCAPVSAKLRRISASSRCWRCRSRCCSSPALAMVPLTRGQGPLLLRRRAPAEHQDAVWDCQDRSGNITTFPPYPPRQYQAQAPADQRSAFVLSRVGGNRPDRAGMWSPVRLHRHPLGCPVPELWRRISACSATAWPFREPHRGSCLWSSGRYGRVRCCSSADTAQGRA